MISSTFWEADPFVTSTFFIPFLWKIHSFIPTLHVRVNTFLLLTKWAWHQALTQILIYDSPTVNLYIRCHSLFLSVMFSIVVRYLGVNAFLPHSIIKLTVHITIKPYLFCIWRDRYELRPIHNVWIMPTCYIKNASSFVSCKSLSNIPSPPPTSTILSISLFQSRGTFPSYSKHSIYMNKHSLTFISLATKT